MILDAQNEFSDAQAVTSTAISENVIDLDLAASDIGAGEPMYLVILTETAATSGGAATGTFTLESSDAAALTSATVHYSTGSKALADFAAAGTVIAAVALPIDEYKRYLGIRYTIGTANLTAGAFDAFLTKDVSKYRAYASGYEIGDGAE